MIEANEGGETATERERERESGTLKVEMSSVISNIYGWFSAMTPFLNNVAPPHCPPSLELWYDPEAKPILELLDGPIEYYKHSSSMLGHKECRFRPVDAPEYVFACELQTHSAKGAGRPASWFTCLRMLRDDDGVPQLPAEPHWTAIPDDEATTTQFTDDSDDRDSGDVMPTSAGSLSRRLTGLTSTRPTYRKTTTHWTEARLLQELCRFSLSFGEYDWGTNHCGSWVDRWCSHLAACDQRRWDAVGAASACDRRDTPPTAATPSATPGASRDDAEAICHRFRHSLKWGVLCATAAAASR